MDVDELPGCDHVHETFVVDNGDTTVAPKETVNVNLIFNQMKKRPYSFISGAIFIVFPFRP